MSFSTMLSSMGEGMLRSCAIFILTILFSMPLGMIIMFLRRSRFRIVCEITKIYIAIMRGTPLMLQLLAVTYGPYYLFGIGVDAFTTDFVSSLLKANLYLLIAAIICATPLSHNLMERFRGLCRRVLDVHTAYSLDRVIKTVIVLILLAISTVRLAGDSYNPFIYFIF